MTQVIGGHLPLEALRAEQEPPAHHAGVADQRGEVVVAVEQRLGADRDLVEVGQLELDDARRAGPRDARRGLLALDGVADRQHDVGAESNEAAGRFKADPAVGAGTTKVRPVCWVSCLGCRDIGGAYGRLNAV